MAEGSSNYIANDIFSPHVMQGIFDVIDPLYPDALKLQEAFFPNEDYTSEEIIAYFRNNFWGMTPPTALGADPTSIGIPGGFYRGYEMGYWGEYSDFTNKDLVQVKNPERPYKADGVTPNLWGEDMMRAAMAHQKHRFNVFKEAFCGSLLGDGTFHVYGDGVDYYFPGPSSTDYILDPHYRLSVVTAGTVSYGGWTTGGTWATASKATPIKDLNEMLLYMARDLGLQCSEIWLSRKNAQYLVDADETAAWVSKNPNLSHAMLTVESGLNALNKIVGDNVQFVLDDRTYQERMVITQPTVASSSTSIYIDNDAPFGSVTTPKIMIRKADGRERLLTATNVSSNVITITASDCDLNLAIGDWVLYNKRFMPEDKIIFKTNRTDLQRFASLPCQTSPGDTFSAGVHTYSQEIIRKPNWKIVAGTLFRGGALVLGSGGWCTLDCH
jgi:hypothetical protein